MMEASRLVFVLNERAMMIKGRYDVEGAAEENFKTLDRNIKIGDFVVVESKARHGLSVVMVTDVNCIIDLKGSTPIKWVVQRLDMAAHKLVLDAERSAMEGVQAAELRAEMDELRAKMFKDKEARNSGLALAHIGDADVPMETPPMPTAGKGIQGSDLEEPYSPGF